MSNTLLPALHITINDHIVSLLCVENESRDKCMQQTQETPNNAAWNFSYEMKLVLEIISSICKCGDVIRTIKIPLMTESSNF